MKLDFFNVDEFCSNLKPVTTSVLLTSKGEYHPDGLFSQRIFGPVKTSTCACGTYWGRQNIGKTCPKCKVDITYSSERRRRFAKIELPFAVMNPIMFSLITEAGKNKIRDIIDNLIFSNTVYGYYFNEETGQYVEIERILKERESDTEQLPNIPENVTVYSSHLSIESFVRFECERQREHNPVWQFIYENMDKFWIHNVIVPPPEFRPTSKSKDSKKKDEFNEKFITILNYSLIMKDDNIGTENISGISEVSYKNLQKHVFDLYNYIFEKMSRKTGLIRGSILGKRVDFSGRAVIAPDPKLKLDECSVPYIMLCELYKLELSNLLIERRMFKTYDQTTKYIDTCIANEDYSLFDLLEECVHGRYVILNRQPTLHRMGVMAFRVKANRDYVIKVHPFICEPYNADFDGDQMAIYRPLNEETEAETREKVSVMANIISPTTGELALGVNQDVVLGLYLLTSPMQEVDAGDIKVIDHSQFNDHQPKNFPDKVYKGRKLFNDCLPDDYIFVNRRIDKKLLKIILNDLARTYSSDSVAKILDKIKDLGFMCTTMSGCTMSLKGMHIKGVEKIVSDILDSDKTWIEKFAAIQDKKVLDIIRDNFPYSIFVESGSRGSWDQVKQIVFSRGYICNFKGEIIQKPIKGNLMAGLTREEFFNSCYGSRKGLLDTAVNTGVSGYLTRKLVYASVCLELDEQCDDCGSDMTLNIKIPKIGSSNIDSLKFAKCLVGRYNVIIDDNGKKSIQPITYSNYHTFVGKTVRLRSPLFCKNEKVCKTCYGFTSDILHSKYIGIIAAQALGELSTQLVLRTFHTSGVAKKSNKNDEKHQDIANDLSSVKKIFHCSTEMSYDEAIMKLFSIYSHHKYILLVHYECIISQMMRVGDQKWRTTKDRDITKYKLVSIESIPSKESWLLALAFSRPKTFINRGILEDETSSSGILEKIMLNESI